MAHYGDSFDVIPDSYDCVTLIGTIMAGAANEECFPELIRVVKPGI